MIAPTIANLGAFGQRDPVAYRTDWYLVALVAVLLGGFVRWWLSEQAKRAKAKDAAMR